MSWFLDLLDPDNKAAVAPVYNAITNAPGEVLAKPNAQWSTDTKIVVGATAAAALFALLLQTSRKSYAKGAASRGGADVDRTGLELLFYGQRQAETAAKVKRAEAANAMMTKLAAARLEAAKKG